MQKQVNIEVFGQPAEAVEKQIWVKVPISQKVPVNTLLTIKGTPKSIEKLEDFIYKRLKLVEEPTTTTVTISGEAEAVEIILKIISEVAQ